MTWIDITNLAINELHVGANLFGTVAPFGQPSYYLFVQVVGAISAVGRHLVSQVKQR